MKWHGKIGFVTTEETAPGVWMENVVKERPYYGDIIQNTRRWDNQSDKVNSDIRVNAKISIVADDATLLSIPQMRYVTYMGAVWSISEIDPSERPRVVLTLGGLYNGEQANTAE